MNNADAQSETCVAATLVSKATAEWRARCIPADNITAMVINLKLPQWPCHCSRQPAFLRRSSTLPLEEEEGTDVETERNE